MKSEKYNHKAEFLDPVKLAGLLWKHVVLILTFGIIGAAALNALLPGFLIQTCMMESMRCNSVMKPGIMVASAVVAALALVNIIVSAIRSRKGAGQ